MARPAVVYFAILITFAVLPLVTPKADFARLQKIKPWDITVINNSYNVLVGISDENFESQGPKLIENMKDIMRAASTKLGIITSGRAKFNVTIVVPSTWTSYSVLADGEAVSKANFFIIPGDSSNTEPEVLRYLKGTSTNSYRAILLPSTYVNKNSQNGDVGNVITEKWFTLRYGENRTYNELLSELQDTTKCAKLCKKLREDLPTFGEVLYSKVEAMQHPLFRIVRQRSKRVVMIVDVSGSMAYDLRLNKAKEGLKQYIKMEQNRDRTSLGLVKFSTRAQTLQNLSNSRSVKGAMSNIVENLTDEQSTSIGAGLQEALEVLNRHEEKADGAEFILISDGEEVIAPFINQTATEVISSSVTVHTIAITNLADTRLDGLGAATGGLSFIHKDDEQGNDLAVAFTAIHGYDESDPASSGIVIFSERSTKRDPTFTVLIDELIGRDTTFVFECDRLNCIFTVNIDSPDQRDFLQYRSLPDSPLETTEIYTIERKRNAGQLNIMITDAKAGTWNVKTISNNLVLGLTVNTYPRDISNYPILAFSFWGKDQIFADDCATNQTMYTLISRDNNPVTGANVTAMIEPSTKGDAYGPYPMYDDGRGRDITKDDGIYTGVFPDSIRNTSETERFNLKVRVDGTITTQVRTRQLVAAAPKESTSMRNSGGESVEGLQRFALGGSYIAMKQMPDSCKVCNMDLVILSYSSRRQEDLKNFLYGIISFYTTAKNNTRVKIGIVDAGAPDDVVIYPDYVIRLLTAFTQWLPKGSSSGQVDFATGLRTAGRLFNNDNRRKVVLLMSDTDTANNVQAARVEADRLRAGGINVIAVGVGKVPSFLRQVIQDHKDIMEVDDYIPSKNTSIVNKACGFMVKKPQQP